jgi:hypothetical protein
VGLQAPDAMLAPSGCSIGSSKDIAEITNTAEVCSRVPLPDSTLPRLWNADKVVDRGLIGRQTHGVHDSCPLARAASSSSTVSDSAAGRSLAAGSRQNRSHCSPA